MAEPFWKTKSLEEMSASEWESLCDGCGKCCLSKLEDEDTGDIYFTSVGCRLFDAGTCRCRDYPNRLAVVQDCVGLTP
ncbi:MAG: YcgN family cysteine cluster protein, partial [Alphaproteobacteria bacterium]|nr:YcgN family cysteine cluster protein [Alphaproteobacteria bacterium]